MIVHDESDFFLWFYQYCQQGLSHIYRYTEESENRFSPLGSKSRENVSLDKLSRYDMILMYSTHNKTALGSL